MSEMSLILLIFSRRKRLKSIDSVPFSPIFKMLFDKVQKFLLSTTGPLKLPWPLKDLTFSFPRVNTWQHLWSGMTMDDGVCYHRVRYISAAGGRIHLLQCGNGISGGWRGVPAVVVSCPWGSPVWMRGRGRWCCRSRWPWTLSKCTSMS